VSFNDGSSLASAESGAFRARCVRGGE
jgi:hypothetical protein